MYFALVVNRWVVDDHWLVTREELFSDIPKLVRNFVTGRIRKSVVAGAYWQGMARFSEQERADRVAKYCESVAAVLGGKPFLFGDTPSAADASVVPMLREAACFPVANKMSQVMLENATLMAYVQRGREAMYPA